VSDEEIQDFIDYFGDQLPNPDHYPLRVKWLMRWYISIVLRNKYEQQDRDR
jgi:hypothetical protein